MIPMNVGACPVASGAIEGSSNPYYTKIAQDCGPGLHWVGRHRNRYGAWVPGHCARSSPNIH